MSDTGKALDTLANAIVEPTLPPVHDWRPSLTRDVDIRIARNGDWFYEGSLIDRPRMVKLFSTVLRVDEDNQTYLVTPVEKLRISVEDAPFTAVLVEQHGAPENPTLSFTTNVGETVVADAQHPVHVEYPAPGGEPSPYLLVRDRLQALISRAVFYQLAEWAEVREGFLGVESAGVFMPLSEPDAMADEEGR